MTVIAIIHEHEAVDHRYGHHLPKKYYSHEKKKAVFLGLSFGEFLFAAALGYAVFPKPT